MEIGGKVFFEFSVDGEKAFPVFAMRVDDFKPSSCFQCGKPSFPREERGRNVKAGFFCFCDFHGYLV